MRILAVIDKITIKMAEAKEFRHLVRVANTDLDGNKPIMYALRKIKGVGFMFSNMVCSIAGVNKNQKAGTLSNPEVAKLDEVITDPLNHGAPEWMVNRRRDLETGEAKHVLTSDLDFEKQGDYKRLQKIKSYRGLRLHAGLPVRGQRTKSNFRRSKRKGGSLGVKRKKK